jgi:hypothetical protein
MDTSRRVCDIQFSLVIALASASSLADPEIARQLYVSRRNRRRRRHDNDFIVAPCVDSLQQWATVPESSFTTIRGSFEARHQLRDLAVNIIDEVSSHNIPVVWALQDLEESTKNSASDSSSFTKKGQYTTKDVLKHIISQLLQQNHTLLNERSMGLNIARFQSAKTEKQWFNLLGPVLEGLNAVYIVIDVDVLASAVMMEHVWPEAFVAVFEQLRQRNVRTKVKVAFLSSGGTRNAPLLGTKGRYCVDLPKIKSGRIEKRFYTRKSRKRFQKQPKLLTE